MNIRRLIALNVRRLGLIHFAAVVAGCSLVSSLDQVKRIPEGEYSSGDATVAPLPPGEVTDAAVVTDSGVDGGALEGAVVVAGQAIGDGAPPIDIVTVLDPKTGAEIAPTKRLKMTVAAIRYDGLRDLWYLFESTNGDFVPGPSDAVNLHVGALDHAGAWTLISKTAVPAPHFYETIAVVRDRIGYVAYAPPDSGTTLEFVTFDTSNPAALEKMDALALGGTPVGALGTRSSTGPGGVVNLLQLNSGACDGGICNAEYAPVRIPNNGQPVLDAPVVIGQSRSASMSGASYAKRELDVVVFPRLSNGGQTLVQMYQPITKQPEGQPLSLTVTDTGLRRAAIAECQGVALIVGTNADLNVHAIPLTGNGSGTPAKASTNHSGQAVYFEPYTQTVITPFNQGAGFDYTAFRLGGTTAEPTLARRETDWSPPKDVRPVFLGIRAPVPFACP